MAMTVEEKTRKQLERDAVKFAKQARDATAKRDEVIVVLNTNGYSLRQIGTLVGLHATTINAILKRDKP